MAVHWRAAAGVRQRRGVESAVPVPGSYPPHISSSAGSSGFRHAIQSSDPPCTSALPWIATTAGVHYVADRLFGTVPGRRRQRAGGFRRHHAAVELEPAVGQLCGSMPSCGAMRGVPKALWDKLRIWFMRTGWRPADVAARYPMNKPDLSQFRKFEVPLVGRQQLVRGAAVLRLHCVWQLSDEP